MLSMVFELCSNCDDYWMLDPITSAMILTTTVATTRGTTL